MVVKFPPDPILAEELSKILAFSLRIITSKTVIMKRWGDIENVEVMLLYVAYVLNCKLGGSLSPKQLIMELNEKMISENHRDEFSATSGRPSISPSPFRLTSLQMLFLQLKKNQIQYVLP
ncbi:piggyBac transposable element-derived protein 4 [Trichonephila clavipes]|nr:piggyBac transposable element-derived protein 4 [Trichonephila clavipes]